MPPRPPPSLGGAPSPRPRKGRRSHVTLFADMWVRVAKNPLHGLFIGPQGVQVGRNPATEPVPAVPLEPDGLMGNRLPSPIHANQIALFRSNHCLYFTVIQRARGSVGGPRRPNRRTI